MLFRWEFGIQRTFGVKYLRECAMQRLVYLRQAMFDIYAIMILVAYTCLLSLSPELLFDSNTYADG